MTDSITMKELVDMVAGPEERPIEYRMGRRVFRGVLKSPGVHVSNPAYQRHEDLVLPRTLDGKGD